MTRETCALQPDRKPSSSLKRSTRSAAASDTADADADVDIDVLRDAIWTAWLTLAPRARVPMVLADASVASRRLAGIDVPETFGSAHRQEMIADEALRSLRARVVSDLPVRAGAQSFPDDHLIGLLDDTLREHAGSASGPIDPYPRVLEHVGRQRRRAVSLVAVVVVVVAVAVTVAVRVSTPDKVTATDAAAAASRSGFLPAPQVVPSAAGATASGLSAQGPFGRPPGRIIEPLVVPWVPRGTAANDSVLLNNLTSYFATVHTDATGQTQVLLATDTPTGRIAYVTSNSPNGVIQSWFYGPRGSDNLVEGATSYGGSMLPDSIIADGLIDGSGDEYFVVIAPPDTTDMQIADFDFTAAGRHVGIRAAAVPERDRGEGHDGGHLGVQLRCRCQRRDREVHGQGRARHSAQAELHRFDNQQRAANGRRCRRRPSNAATQTRRS